jgi:DNA-binding transcriptional ArsR family regulator
MTKPRIDQAAWRHGIIKSALKYPVGSAGRSSAVEAIAADQVARPGGERVHLSKRTVYRWIEKYERAGIAELKRRQRRDSGRRRLAISRPWDRAVPFEPGQCDRIKDELQRYINSAWGNGAPSWQTVRRLASSRLVELTRAAGFEAPIAELKRLCKVPRRFVEDGRKFQAVAIMEKDAKRHFDGRPRVRRHDDNYAPMDIVIGDVHPIDILIRRDDGSTATPKMVAWTDYKTNRLFADVAFLPEGKGIRQEHVALSLIRLTQAWGMPRALYLDNGREYNWAHFIDGAMAVADVTIAYLRDRPAVADDFLRGRPSMVINALPYNAPAKPIEGIFGNLERRLSIIPGHIGGNRMTKKTANVGREPEVFPGSDDELRAAIAIAIDAYETTPQHGRLKGKSPREAFNDAVAAGWSRVDVEPLALAAAFSVREVRRVRQGAIAWKGTRFTHEELWRLPAGTCVQLRIPLIGDRSRIDVLDDGGRLICTAEEDRPYDFLDAAGARESARRAAVHREAITAMGRDIDHLDLVAETAKANALEPAEAVAKSAGMIKFSDEIEAITSARRALPQPVPRNTALEEIDQRFAAMKQITSRGRRRAR